MMREIKFRGKRIDNGEWIYGAFMKHIRRTPCMIGDSLKESDNQHLMLVSGFSDWNMPKPIDCYEIKQETIGQFTGLRDIKRNEIYEGDILRWHGIDNDGTAMQQNDEVFYKDGCFMVKNIKGKFPQEETLLDYLRYDFETIEVIGNIYETEEQT